jgi:hypothetical protein
MQINRRFRAMIGVRLPGRERSSFPGNSLLAPWEIEQGMPISAETECDTGSGIPGSTWALMTASAAWEAGTGQGNRR